MNERVRNRSAKERFKWAKVSIELQLLFLLHSYQSSEASEVLKLVVTERNFLNKRIPLLKVISKLQWERVQNSSLLST